MFAAGAAGLVLAAAGSVVNARFGGVVSSVAAWAGVLGALIATYGLGMGAYMTWASRIGKVRARERLLDVAGELRPDGRWRGDEQVLDVGCGRGLMLVGAAQRLTTGTATGIDVWRSEDQANNGPDGPLENARHERVADRVRVETGDARALPFADASFDVVLSHWVVHNLPRQADRLRALDEMLRVLRPGGVVVLADIANLAEYHAHLASRGIREIRFFDGGWEARVMGTASGGSYRPQALLARCDWADIPATSR